MSQTTTAPGTTATEQPKPAAAIAPVASEPKPASIAELKAAFPGDANATFVLAAAENAWTIDEARAAYGVITSQVAAQTAAAATSAAKPAEAVAKKPGVPAIASAAAEAKGAAGTDGGASAQLEAAVKPLVDGGMNRQKAVQKVLAENEQLRADYIREKSAGGSGR